jgi:glycosyltransferase involved in cell wall biosynthesis
MSNSYWQSTGYGRYSAHMARALIRRGLDVRPMTYADLTMPRWMREMVGIDWDSRLTIACIPPFHLPDRPHGRMWLLSMTEGSGLPKGWAECVEAAHVERVIVPCEHNAAAFRAGGVKAPIHVIPGGTDPDEYPLFSRNGFRRPQYTFLALADRGARKGWIEVWDAFYQTFGRPQDTPDVRLIVKTMPNGNDLVERIAPATTDPRITFWIEDVQDTADIWSRADCVVLPSRSEGWGMPHREAAIMGIPTIVPRHSGLDDGHTGEWATVVLEQSTTLAINVNNDKNIAGDWYRMDVGEIGQAMRWCYEHPGEANAKAHAGALWLRQNQTWDHAGAQLAALLERYY